MKYFTIDTDNNITYYTSAKEWRESHGSKNITDKGFSSEVQFADAIGNDNPRLIEIWNSLPGVTPVKKFTNRKIATERIWRAIQSLGGAHAGVESAVLTRKAAKGTKESQAIAMMKRPGGATISELMSTFGWQAHTVRGFVAGALGRKLGLTVVSSKPEGGERTYTIGG